MFNEIEVRVTNDGSNTLFLPHLNEHYHSIHGALQESNHIFIKNGLEKISDKKTSINVLEIGFGTGLNALLTIQYSLKKKIKIYYHTIEPYPIIDKNIWKSLNYTNLLNDQFNNEYFKLHESEWEKEINFNSLFYFFKQKIKIQNCDLKLNHFDVIFFDAFSPSSQPDLWEEDVLQKMNQILIKNGFLVTYCSKGEVKRKLKKNGFIISSLPGPPGKREMTFAKKT